MMRAKGASACKNNAMSQKREVSIYKKALTCGALVVNNGDQLGLLNRKDERHPQRGFELAERYRPEMTPLSTETSLELDRRHVWHPYASMIDPPPVLP
ncbi:MAG: hypothetical protein HZC44_14020, partial [Geobacter sp.]|nr:hypothetical protein [Geobacter sp.]